MKKIKSKKVISNIKIGTSKKAIEKATKNATKVAVKASKNITKQFNQTPGRIKRAYQAVRNFFLGRKSPYENIFQYVLRQFLFPDSRGKPSLTATFFVWIMVVISYLTWVACGIAVDPVTTVVDGKVVETYYGFSDALIYLYIVIVGYLGYMFIKRENREIEQGAEPPANGGSLITTVINSAKSLITKK